MSEENKIEFPGEVHPTDGGGILVTKLDDVINWARANSLWPLVFGTSCCAIEMMSAADAKYDWSRFGFEVARATPRQADLIIDAGTIVIKMAFFIIYGIFISPCSFTRFHSFLSIEAVSIVVGKIQYFKIGLISTILLPPYPKAPMS